MCHVPFILVDALKAARKRVLGDMIFDKEDALVGEALV